jgi:peptidoglycan/LPS O-acetylase OafA/YrhL
VTVTAATWVLTPLRWQTIADQGWAASLYVSNRYFADAADDYFAIDLTAAPLLHTWSLAVEQQFYLLWPLLVAGALALGRRLGRPRVLAAVLAVVAAASFLHSTALVADGSSTAFYGLASRTWEFALAGLLAIATVRPRRWSAGVATTVAAAGGAAIALTATGYDEATAFPGWAAVPPVLGTLAIVAAGAASRATWPLAVRPVRWIGGVSYSWYLWHWPAMVLTVAWLGHDTVAVRLGAGLAALVVAWVSLRLLEDPVRSSRWLKRSLPATFAMAAGFTALGLGASALVDVRLDRARQGDFHRALAEAADKDYLADCAWDGEDPMTRTCTLGDPDGAETVLVSGDSHAMSWAPGFDLAGQELGVRILVRAASSCPGAPVGTLSEHTYEVNQSCVGYRDETHRIIDREQPELVVLVSSDFTRRAIGADGERIADREGQLTAWHDAIVALRADLADQDIALAGVLDNPRMTTDPLVCVEEAGDATACDVDRDQALRRVRLHIANERDAFGAGAVLEAVPMVCDDERCRVEQDGIYAFADATHLSRPFTESRAGEVTDFLQAQGVGG